MWNLIPIFSWRYFLFWFFLAHFFIVSKLRELWHFHCFKFTGLQFLNIFRATILNHEFEKICYKGKEKYKQELWNLFSENKYWLNCRSTKCIKYSWKYNITDFRLNKQYRVGQSIECIFLIEGKLMLFYFFRFLLCVTKCCWSTINSYSGIQSFLFSHFSHCISRSN